MHVSRGDEQSVQLGPEAGLEAILAAWHGATLRLEQTHLALSAEVRRLTHELEVKNRELARKNRLAVIGQMAAHVAHEVRNHLVPVTLYLSLLRRRVAGDGPGLQVIEKLDGAFAALGTMVQDLLNFTADRDPQRVPLDVPEVIDEVLQSLAPQLAAQHIGVELDLPHHDVLLADRDMLRRALVNLLFNAVDAMPGGGSIQITAVDVPDALEVEVADSGPGLSLDARRHVFEPFYTTKPHGTGLGLAIVYRVAEAHGGSVSAVNCPEGGAAFTLRLPRRGRQRLQVAA